MSHAGGETSSGIGARGGGIWQVFASSEGLRTTAEAWKLFCERLSIPPFAVWEGLPGFERLQQSLALAEKCAFQVDAWLAWLNSVCPPGEAQWTAPPITVSGSSAGLEALFRQRVAWWGG